MLVKYKSNKIKLPDFFCIGAAKSATTTLYRILDQHKYIYLPESKEPGFFSFGGKEPFCTEKKYVRYIIWKKEDYINLFKSAPDHSVIGEASTCYMYFHTETIKNIKKIYGPKAKKIKWIAILRNPVDRAFSHYKHTIRRSMEDLTFEEAIKPENIKNRKIRTPMQGFDFIGYGMYYDQIKSFMNTFPNYKIILFDDYLKDLERYNKEVIEFLGLENYSTISYSIRANPSGRPKSKNFVNLLQNENLLKNIFKNVLPHRIKNTLVTLRDRLIKINLEEMHINQDTRLELGRVFSNDVKKLEKLINRDLSAWLLE